MPRQSRKPPLGSAAVRDPGSTEEALEGALGAAGGLPERTEAGGPSAGPALVPLEQHLWSSQDFWTDRCYGVKPDCTVLPRYGVLRTDYGARECSKAESASRRPGSPAAHHPVRFAPSLPRGETVSRGQRWPGHPVVRSFVAQRANASVDRQYRPCPWASIEDQEAKIAVRPVSRGCGGKNRGVAPDPRGA